MDLSYVFKLWSILILVSFSATARLNNESISCVDDRNCPMTEFCNNYVCESCLNCTLLKRHHGILQCVKKIKDCGRCFDGFNLVFEELKACFPHCLKHKSCLKYEEASKFNNIAIRCTKQEQLISNALAEKQYSEEIVAIHKNSLIIGVLCVVVLTAAALYIYRWRRNGSKLFTFSIGVWTANEADGTTEERNPNQLADRSSPPPPPYVNDNNYDTISDEYGTFHLQVNGYPDYGKQEARPFCYPTEETEGSMQENPVYEAMVNVIILPTNQNNINETPPSADVENEAVEQSPNPAPNASAPATSVPVK